MGYSGRETTPSRSSISMYSRWVSSLSPPAPGPTERGLSRRGWARQAVEVIDADLGLSGRSADHRSGFKDLVGRVCLGKVGAIFGLEVSRLARSSADLSLLLELARLTDTSVVDSDGIYDLPSFNDRLLLGLKGTMSEAELHFLAGRLQGAKRAAAERGRALHKRQSFDPSRKRLSAGLLGSLLSADAQARLRGGVR